jgi:hypothetical protein
MRHYLFCIIFVLSLSSEGKAQQPSFPRFLKTVERYFDRDVFPEDSCFSNATMLRVELNDDYKVQSILLADNAETWQKRSLEKIKYRLPIVEIEAYAKIHEIKNAAFHFPFFVAFVSLWNNRSAKTQGPQRSIRFLMTSPGLPARLSPIES